MEEEHIPKNEMFVERRPDDGNNILLRGAHTLEHQLGIRQILHSLSEIIYKQFALDISFPPLKNKTYTRSGKALRSKAEVLVSLAHSNRTNRGIKLNGLHKLSSVDLPNAARRVHRGRNEILGVT